MTDSYLPKLIIVDDEPEMAKFIAEIASDIGFETRSVFNGESFLGKYESERHDVIVLDLCMPGIDGVESIQELAKLECDAEILIISGYGDALLECTRTIAKGRGLNLLGTLAKPFSLKDLEDFLNQAYSNVCQ